MDLSVIEKIDFTAVGATNLKPLDVSDALVKEKLSFLILAGRMKDPTYNPTLDYSEFEHASHDLLKHNFNINRQSDPCFTVEKSNKRYAISLNSLHNFSFYEIAECYPKLSIYQSAPRCINIKPGASFEDISIFDATRKEIKCSEKDRIEELLQFYHLGRDAYASYSLNSSRFKLERFKASLKDMPKSDKDGFVRFQQELVRWFLAGFPRSYTVNYLEKKQDQWGRDFYSYNASTPVQIALPEPVFYPPIGAMAFDIVEKHSLPQMRLYRIFHNPDNCGLRQALIPTISIQEKIGNEWGTYNVMTCFPEQKKIPLYNINKVSSPKVDTIVICGCIEDAYALQKANSKLGDVAFTSFVPDNMEQPDWSPIAGKSIIILVSGDKGKDLKEVFEKTNIIYEFLQKYIQERKIKIKNIGFVFRQVEYPDSTSIASPADLASAYFHNPPHVVGNVKPMDEAEFRGVVRKIKETCSILLPWETSKKEPTEIKKRKWEEDFLVRGFLYKGAITELCSKAGAGKTNIALAAGRYVVAGDKPFMKDRFWTRCRETDVATPKKVVYWGGSDVSERDIESWNFVYKEGLSRVAFENFFIEPAPECMTEMTLDLNAYNNALMNYTYRGVYGQIPDLLIIDHLSDIAGEKKIYEALSFLSKLKKGFPNLSILALHHLADPGNIRKGSEAKMKPRVVIVIKRIKQEHNNSQATAQRVWEFRYEKQNVQLSDQEADYPFIVVSHTDGGYTVDSICSKKDFGKLIAYHYRKEIRPNRTVEEVAALMGCSKSNVEKQYIAKPDEIERINEEFVKKCSKTSR